MADEPASPPRKQNRVRKPRARGRITEIRAKIRAGLPVTDEEREHLGVYNAKYTPRKQGVHLVPERLAFWRSLAEAQGLSLSSWICERVEQSLAGPGEALQQAQQEIHRLNQEILALRGTSGQLAMENTRLNMRLEGVEANLVQAVDRLLNAEKVSA